MKQINYFYKRENVTEEVFYHELREYFFNSYENIAMFYDRHPELGECTENAQIVIGNTYFNLGEFYELMSHDARWAIVDRIIDDITHVEYNLLHENKYENGFDINDVFSMKTFEIIEVKEPSFYNNLQEISIEDFYSKVSSIEFLAGRAARVTLALRKAIFEWDVENVDRLTKELENILGQIDNISLDIK